jgi:hypothetical protein
MKFIGHEDGIYVDVNGADEWNNKFQSSSLLRHLPQRRCFPHFGALMDSNIFQWHKQVPWASSPETPNDVN